MKALIASELRQRVRGKRWWILLALWVLVLWGLLALVNSGVEAALRRSFEPDLEVGTIMFGSLALFVLGLVGLVAPALTATSINSERDRGTLAVLQATLLRPWEIVAAKFLAAGAMAAAYLAATVPLALWCFAEGGVEPLKAAVVYLVLLVVTALLLVVGLTASALLRKSTLSVLASYAVVFFLTVGLPILFGLAMLTAPQETRNVGGFQSVEPRVGWRWVLLAPDPFVLLADAAPRSTGEAVADPLDVIRDIARDVREPGGGTSATALWPMGLAIDAALFALGGLVAVGRLRIPARRLAPGERVA